MGRTTTTLLLGLAVGALSVVLIRRIQQVLEQDDPEVLVDRLAHQLEALENRLGPGGKAPQARGS